jgi:hypothetical protein
MKLGQLILSLQKRFNKFNNELQDENPDSWMIIAVKIASIIYSQNIF